MHTPNIQSDYLAPALQYNYVYRFMKQAVSLVKQYDFQAFAFSGMSGALVAPLLAYRTHKTMIMVRKPKTKDDEGNSSDHSYLRVEGDAAAQRYIIVDDFTASGRTLRHIVKEISEFAPEARCLGCLFYRDSMLYTERMQIEFCSVGTCLQQFVVNDLENWRIK